MAKSHYEIELDINAEISIDESYQFYNKRQSGLGVRFIESIEEVFQTIIKNPLLYPVKGKDYHVAPVRTFPFLILYRVRVETKTIIVLEVFHTSRNPEKRP